MRTSILFYICLFGMLVQLCGQSSGSTFMLAASSPFSGQSAFYRVSQGEHLALSIYPSSTFQAEQGGIPNWVGYGLAGLGEGIFIAGLFMDRGQDEYDTYSQFTNPNASVYNEKSRDQFYEDSNDKYRLRQGVLWVGAGVIAAGVIVLVNNLIIKPNKENKNGIGLRLTPGYQHLNQQIAMNGGSVIGMGCAIQW